MGAGNQRRWKTIVVIAVLLGIFSFSPLTVSAADSLAQQETMAENYLKDTVTEPTVSSVGGEWSVIALARGDNLTAKTKETYIENLLAALNETKGVLSKRKYSEYSRAAAALTAVGVDPENIGGYNLLQPLADFDQVTLQGINGAVYALIAFDTKEYTIPPRKDGQDGAQTTREGIISYILEKQLKGGGWGLKENPDDLTAMGIQALIPYRDRSDVNEAIDSALCIISEMQAGDGGFSFGGSESISQAVIALASLDYRLLSDERFVKNGCSLLDALLSYQCENGAFRHFSGKDEDLMATEQAALALEAYTRAVNGEKRLYDMTDVEMQKSHVTENLDAENEPSQPEAKGGMMTGVGVSAVFAAVIVCVLIKRRRRVSKDEQKKI